MLPFSPIWVHEKEPWRFLMFWMMLFSCDAVTEQYNVAADPSDDTEFIFTVPKGANARKLGAPLQKKDYR